MLSRDRFDGFVDLVASKLALRDKVEWQGAGAASRGHGAEAAKGTERLLVDLTAEDSGEQGGVRGRRMFVQVP